MLAADRPSSSLDIYSSLEDFRNSPTAGTPARCSVRSGTNDGRKASLANAGRALISRSEFCSRPDSRESDVDDGQWRREQRENIKKGISHSATRPKTSDFGLGGLKAPQVLPPLKQRPGTGANMEEILEESLIKKAEDRVKEGRAQASACWEDLISFLELNKLPGAYALAFSAYGVEDLSSLLLLDNVGLSNLLERCNFDAMDEIMLLEALRETRAFHQ